MTDARSETSPVDRMPRPALDALDGLGLLLVADVDAGITHASQRLCERLGCSFTELRHRDPGALVHADDRTAVVEAGRLAATRGDSQVLRVRLRGAADTELWTQAHIMPVGASGGGWMMLAIDVSEQKRTSDLLGAMSERVQALVAHIQVGVVLADQWGKIAFANKAASNILGYAPGPAAMVGQDAMELRHDTISVYQEPEIAFRRIDEIKRRREPVINERVDFASGQSCARTYLPIVDDSGAWHGNLWLFRDLTEELAVAREREHLLELQRAQNARLVELDELKTELVASVSHELRTPITSIVSFTHLLQDGLGTDTVEDQREFTDIIVRNTDRLLRLVDDLLMLDKLESGTVQLQVGPVDIVQLVSAAVTSQMPLAERKNVRLELSTAMGPTLSGDKDRLGQLADNLITNAVKFTPAGGYVQVTVAPRTPPGWRLEVRDTGIGIPSEEMDRLFQRFFRASNARHEGTSGSGLGLAIAHRVARVHAGTIDLTSGEGHGTTVTVTLGDALDNPGPYRAPSGTS